MTYWYAEQQAAGFSLDGPLVHLLPNYDEHVVAYTDHAMSFAAEALAMRSPRQDILRNHFALNGEVIGEWRRVVTKRAITIHPRPLRPLTPPEREAFQSAAERYGRLMNLPVSVEWG